MRIHIFLLSSSFKIITSTIYGFQIQHTTSGQNILLDCEFRPFLSSFFFGILLVDYWDSCATGEKKKDIRVNKDKHYCRCKSKRQHLDFSLLSACGEFMQKITGGSTLIVNIMQ